MSDLPEPVAAYVSGVALGEQPLAYLRLDAEGRVAHTGGRVGQFGLEGVEGRPAELVLDCLVGLLPAEGPPVTLPAVEVARGIHADVHVVEADAGAWVVLIDRSERIGERRFAQQLANDMSLLREELARRPQSDGAWETRFTVAESGERRVASVITARLDGVATAPDSPVELVQAAGFFGRAMRRAVVDDAGVVTSSTGDRLTAVFGALPTTLSPAVLAAGAAVRVAGAVADLNDARARAGRAPFPLSAGVATGEMTLGAIGGRAHAVLVAIGPPAERSAGLIALGAEVAIDAPTYDQLDELATRFRRADGPDAIYVYQR